MRIHYICFEEATGYGTAAAGLIHALKEAGAEVSVTALRAGRPERGGHLVREDAMGPADGVIVHTVPEYYPFWLGRVKARTPGVPVWGYAAWETDRLPPHWPKLLNGMDGMMVPSAWNKEVFVRSGVTRPIQVVPHVSEFHGQLPSDPPSEVAAKALDTLADRFTFYTVGVWSERKNTALLLQAFLEEFSGEEQAALLLKTGEQDWSSYRPRWRRLLTLSPSFHSSSNSCKRLMRPYGPRCVVHLPQRLASIDLAWLHARSQCFISLTRGEGWGMGAYEAAWFGNGVAITGYGGQLDYLPADAAFHLPYALKPVSASYGRRSYRQDQNWACVDLKTARQAMRAIFADQAACKARGEKLQQAVREQFSPRHIASCCLQVFQ